MKHEVTLAKLRAKEEVLACHEPVEDTVLGELLMEGMRSRGAMGGIKAGQWPGQHWEKKAVL